MEIIVLLIILSVIVLLIKLQNNAQPDNKKTQKHPKKASALDSLSISEAPGTKIGADKVESSLNATNYRLPKTKIVHDIVSRPAAPPVLRPQQWSFCALDTETTGLVPRSPRHRAFEISCVRFTPDGNNVWSETEFTRYIKIDTQEMKNLKLSSMWLSHSASGGQKNAIDAYAALNDLRSFVGKLPIVCHHASFDKSVLTNEIRKTNFKWEIDNYFICTLQMARAAGFGSFVGYSRWREDGKSYRLGDVAASLDLEFNTSSLHVGHYDAALAGKIFLKILYEKKRPIIYI